MGKSVSVGRDRAFDQNDLEELVRQGICTVQKAKEVSTSLETVISNLIGIEAGIMPEAKDGSFSTAIHSLTGTLEKDSYDDAIVSLKSNIGKLRNEMPSYDTSMGGHLEELGNSLKSIEQRVQDLNGLLHADSVDKSYEDFMSDLKACKDGWDTSTADLAEKIKEAEGNMKGISARAG